MKKILLALCAMLVSAPAYADTTNDTEWFQYGTSNSGDVFYVRTDDVLKQASPYATNAVVWSKMVSPAGGPYSHVMNKISVNCLTQTYRMLGVVAYRPDGTSNLIRSTPGEARPIVPDSMTDSLGQLVCYDYSAKK